MKQLEISAIWFKLSAVGLAGPLALPDAAARSSWAAKTSQWCSSDAGEDQRKAACSAVLKTNPNDTHALTNRSERDIAAAMCDQHRDCRRVRTLR